MIEIVIDGVTYDPNPDRFSFGEAIRVEKVTGQTWTEFCTDMSAGRPLAWKAAIWVLLRRNNAELRFDDLDDMSMDDVEFVLPQPEPEKKPRKKAAEPVGEPVDPTQKAS